MTERWIGRIGSPDDGPPIVADGGSTAGRLWTAECYDCDWQSAHDEESGAQHAGEKHEQIEFDGDPTWHEVEVRAEDITTDGGFEIEGEDCGRCGGSGPITKAVAGRSGLVPCPECENVPVSVIPNDPPDDPQERLAEIEERSDDLTEKKECVRGLRSDIHEARDLLAEAASSDLVPDDTGTKFDHITDQIEMLLRSFDVARGIHYEQWGRERNELYTLLEYTGGEDGQ